MPQLTKEHFDKVLNGLAGKDDLKQLVTKTDLDEKLNTLATKTDLKEQEGRFDEKLKEQTEHFDKIRTYALA